MDEIRSSPEIKDLLISLGYHSGVQDIADELDILFKEIDLDKIKQTAASFQEAKDTTRLIGSLKELMITLEHKGYYRPDYPTELIRLLVNGLNHKNEDIFALLDKAKIQEVEKRNEKEFLASCAAITQLGYILLNFLVPGVKTACSGSHVFITIDGFSPDSMIFVDFSIDSIRAVDVKKAYHRKENYYYLKDTGYIHGLDGETSSLLTEYYSSFRLSSGIGLSHNIHNNLGIAYDKIGRYEEAIKELHEALRLEPCYAEVHNNLAVTFGKMERYEEAINEFQEAIRLNPGYAEAHSNLGCIYAGLGRHEEGIEELKTALQLKPDYAGAHNIIGNIYADQKRDTEAIKEFQEAIRINPVYVLPHNNLGDIYAGLGRYEDALREFHEALRLDPEFPAAYHGIGSAYYNLGSYERASQAWIRAVYLDPELLDHVPEKLSLKVRQGISRLRGRA